MLRKARLLSLLLFVLLGRESLSAQGKPADPRTTDERLAYFIQRREAVLSPAGNVPVAQRQPRLDAIPDVFGNNFYAFVYYALKPEALGDSFKEFLQTAANTRV